MNGWMVTPWAPLLAMMGLGMSMAIPKQASAGAAPNTQRLDFSVAANSQYVPLIFAGYP